MTRYVLDFEDIDQTRVALVGGKGAHLGELSRIEGIRVPAGFCVTTEAFQRIMAEAPSVDELLGRLARLQPDDRDAIRTISAEIRQTFEGIPIPDHLADAITGRLAQLGEEAGYAVRSSATAEDLPSASFAGQQDTYLNVVGSAAILEHISRCWASLFTERAVNYRVLNGFGHRDVSMAVVIQQMVFPQAAGVLFTADPVTSNRKLTSVEASLGLGEALVSGRLNPDVYNVRDGKIVERTIAAKQVAIHAVPGGGTREDAIDPRHQQQPALTDAQVVELARLGRRIEAHFGRPQDIEWCLVDGVFHVLQSRPITTLFPIPATSDEANHVYVSVGHQQMMTDPMKPLGLSMWQLTTPRPMSIAGGRLFVDVTQILASPASRAGLLELFGKGDPLLRDALETVIERDDFPPAATGGGSRRCGAARRRRRSRADRARPSQGHGADRRNPGITRAPAARHPRQVGAGAVRVHPRRPPGAQASAVRSAQPPDLHGGDGRCLVAERAARGLAGREECRGHASQSVAHNVTSEMGLALLDVADVIRPHPELVEFLEQVDDDGFLDELPRLDGGAQARDAIEAYLDRYGMRCVGEVDITRPRWSEHPAIPRAVDPRQRQELRAGRGREALRAGPEGGPGAGAAAAGASAAPARRGAEGTGDQAQDRHRAHLHRVPGVSEVRHGQPLLRLQAGAAGRGRAPRAGRRAP